MSALQLDMTELQELSRLLSSKTSEMSMIGSSENEQDASLTEEIGHILGRARSQIRAIKLKLRECQHPDPNKSFTTTPTLISTHSSPQPKATAPPQL